MDHAGGRRELSPDMQLRARAVLQLHGYRTSGVARSLATWQTDSIALLCYHELKLEVADDLAIIGYDDNPMSPWVMPAITSCKVPFEAGPICHDVAEPEN
jgi:DNA-binding LacI/PurR family transcriptional regulator